MRLGDTRARWGRQGGKERVVEQGQGGVICASSRQIYFRELSRPLVSQVHAQTGLNELGDRFSAKWIDKFRGAQFLNWSLMSSLNRVYSECGQVVLKEVQEFVSSLQNQSEGLKMH